MAVVRAIYSLIESIVGAFAGIAGQVGQFIHWIFWGDSGLLLGAALALLAVAAGVAGARSKRGAIHFNLIAAGAEDPARRDWGYYLVFALLVGAVALLTNVLIDIAAPTSLADAETVRGANARSARTAQLPVTVLVMIATCLHLLWFVADIVASWAKWRRGSDFLARLHRFRIAYYMILPTMFLIGLFLYVPAVTVFFYSFFQYDIGGQMTPTGFGNYIEIFQDAIFWKSVRNMLLLTTLSLFLTLSVPLIVAELIFHLRTERWRYYLRAAFVVPMVIPGVIVFIIWEYFYTDVGLISLFGHVIGLGNGLEGLLSRPSTALFAVVFVGFPFVSGINLLIFYAGLSNIDEAIWEAARMDGATALNRFFKIDIPLLARQFKLLLILGIIGGVQSFENVLVMTQGGPGWETMLPGLYMYRIGLPFNEYGLACAIGVLLFAFVLTLSLVVNRGVAGRA